jgi:hypothetical protein|tara:strand:+ start:1909 stop:2265 length:357 start_codon:yes stop_codon:yes gene_type:complete
MLLVSTQFENRNGEYLAIITFLLDILRSYTCSDANIVRVTIDYDGQDSRAFIQSHISHYVGASLSKPSSLILLGDCERVDLALTGSHEMFKMFAFQTMGTQPSRPMLHERAFPAPLEH